MKNRSIADQLADVREEISRLKVTEQRLRKEIVSSGEPLIRGDDAVAVVTETTSNRLDTKALIAELDNEFVQRFMRKRTTATVRILPIKGPSRAEWSMINEK